MMVPEGAERPSRRVRSRDGTLGRRGMELDCANAVSMRFSDAPQSISAKVVIVTSLNEMVMEGIRCSSGWKLGTKRGLATVAEETVP